MMDQLARCAPLSGSYPLTYFAGANTADGFVSAYPAWIREAELHCLYVIKGGSGTGKSSMMKACAALAAQMGASVTLLLCSSDPSSADAVLLHGKNGCRIAILDGTAPHMTDPELPGAVGEIVNVGKYWDAAALAGRREEIASLAAAKKAAYARAYRFLSAYRQASLIRRELLAPCMLWEKMNASADRAVAQLKAESAAREELRHTYALSMTGAYHLTTQMQRAGKCFLLLDRHGAAEFYLEAIRRAALQRYVSLELSPSPASPELLRELLLPASGMYFGTVSPHAEEAETDAGHINMQRFLNREEVARRRARLRFADRCRGMLLDGALDALREAGVCHFALEKIYKSEMDFDGVSRETDRMCERIGMLLEGRCPPMA
ncbi:MAG: hypothetical protein ACI3XP_08025 [Eubacteriales bacterium]